MKNYKIILQSGKQINMPRDKARSKYEYLSLYGLQAVVERVSRSNQYKKANDEIDDHIRAIVLPNGKKVTAF